MTLVLSGVAQDESLLGPKQDVGGLPRRDVRKKPVSQPSGEAAGQWGGQATRRPVGQ